MEKNKRNNKNENKKDNNKDNANQEPKNNGWQLNSNNPNVEFGEEFCEDENKNKNHRNHNNDNRSHSNFKHTENSDPKSKRE